MAVAILDQPYTAYTSNFKEQALRRIIVDHEPLYHVALDLGLKSYSMLSNWLREYRKNGYNIVNKQRGPRPMNKREQLINQENHRLKQEIERLRQQNLKLKIENEFVKN